MRCKSGWLVMGGEVEFNSTECGAEWQCLQLTLFLWAFGCDMS